MLGLNYCLSVYKDLIWNVPMAEYHILAAHALAPLALSAARCEQCRFVPEMIIM